MTRSFLFASILTLIFCSEALSQSSTRICIGEKKCPASHDAMYPCGRNPADIAQEICTVRLGGGQTKVLPHQVIEQGTHKGNKCGYSWYLVKCLPG